MTIRGLHYIDGQWQAAQAPSWHNFDPANNQPLSDTFAEASLAEVDTAVTAAWQTFLVYRQADVQARAEFLRAIADEIMALGDALVNTVMAESGLPQARVVGERGRTVNQLRFFADNLLAPSKPALVDEAQPQREPLPKVDHRMGHVALGPVAVFGASNFPLAFSAAGGDTASALAAGCPVVVKGHPAHPATSELITQAIASAIEQTGMPKAVFSLLQGQGHELSGALVKHQYTQAVGFTGSNKVGTLLADMAARRPQPIPFYGELGANNPQVILPQKLAADAEALAKMQVASMMMGHGQFCTSPGMVVVMEGEGLAAYRQAIVAELQQQQAGAMLTPGIAATYVKQVDGYANTLTTLARGDNEGHKTGAAMFEVAAESLNQALMDECFGPCALLVVCKDKSQLLQTLQSLHGQLTASIHATDKELAANVDLIATLELKVGRLIFNQMPTGVEVCHAMFHGGPSPASTDGRYTSVGSEAIWRFVRPICYQNMPQAVMPKALRDGEANQLRN